MMGVPFYDCAEPEPTPEGWLDVERIYCFDWDDFDVGEMDRLQAIFSSSPRSKQHDTDDNHWWNADHDNALGGFLTARSEFPELQVFGTLPAAGWTARARTFQERAAGLPIRPVS